MQKRIKWGVLGCARIAEEQTLPAMMNAYNAIPFAIAGRRMERVSQFQDRFGFHKGYNDYMELLKDPDVDAVYIPLPNSLHKEWIIKAVENGKPVLCEKPITLNPRELVEIKEVSMKYGIPVMEAFAFRQSPAVKKICQLIDEGAIGRINVIQTNVMFMLENAGDFRLDRSMGGGSVYDVGTYNINFLNMIMKTQPKEISASAKLDEKCGVDMDCTWLFSYEDGTRANGYCGMDSVIKDDYQIIGEKGIIDFPYDLNACGLLNVSLIQMDKTTTYTIDVPNNYQSELEHFGRVVSGEEMQLLSLDESIANMETTLRILEKIHL